MSNRFPPRACALSACFVALGACLTSCGGRGARAEDASTTLLLQRSELDPSDEIDWRVVNVDSYEAEAPKEFMTKNGLFVRFDGADLEDYDQFQGYQIWNLAGCEYWAGRHFDFSEADVFARTYCGVRSHVALMFSSPVKALGGQFQPRAGNRFTIFVRAYDPNNTLLCEYSSNFQVKGLRDGSAPFFGVRSRSRNISKIVFRVLDDSANSADYKDEVWVNKIDIER